MCVYVPPPNHTHRAKMRHALLATVTSHVQHRASKPSSGQGGLHLPAWEGGACLSSPPRAPWGASHHSAPPHSRHPWLGGACGLPPSSRRCPPVAGALRRGPPHRARPLLPTATMWMRCWTFWVGALHGEGALLPTGPPHHQGWICSMTYPVHRAAGPPHPVVGYCCSC